MSRVPEAREAGTREPVLQMRKVSPGLPTSPGHVAGSVWIRLRAGSLGASPASWRPGPSAVMSRLLRGAGPTALSPHTVSHVVFQHGL